MPRTHLAFKRIRPAVVDAANTLFDQKPWRLEDIQKAQVAQQFVNTVSQSYGVMRADVEIHPTYGPAQYSYSPAVFEADSLDDEPRLIQYPKIRMRGWSITTLLVAVRSHLLSQEGDESRESDPEGWAHSLFYAARPGMFRARAREGRILGVTARDTFSADSWDKLVLAGFALGDRLVGGPEQWSEVLGVRISGSSALNANPVIDELPDEAEYDEELSDDELASIFGEEENLEVRLPDADLAEDDAFTDEENAIHYGTEETISEVEAEVNRAVEMFEVVAEGSFDTETNTLSMSDGLDHLNRDAIRALAAEHNIEGRGRMNKDALVAALRELGVTG